MTTPSQPSDNELDTLFTPPSQAQWLAAAQAGLPADSNLESLQHQTLDGLNIQVLYHDNPATPESATPTSTLTAVETGSRPPSWDNRLCITDTRQAGAANREIQAGLQGGNTSIELHVDVSTDLATLLQGVLLELAPVSFRVSQNHTGIVRQYQSLLEQRSLSGQTLRCSFNQDPLGQWLQSGIEPASLDSEFKTMARFSQDTVAALPLASTLMVDTALHHNAGASHVQELQAAIATGTLYLSHLLDAGMTLAEADSCMVFQMACDADVLMTSAKLRSLRTLWQHVLKQFSTPLAGAELGAATRGPTLIAETSRRYLSRLDPWNNHLRNIAACSAAAMGGAQTIIVHPHDRIDSWRASTDPDIGSRMARNLPIILERESWLTQVEDPFAGSYAVETLTTQLSDMTWQALADMGDLDQWLTMIRTGEWRRQLAQTQRQRMSRLSEEEQIVVGVNRYLNQDETDKFDSGQGMQNSEPYPAEQTEEQASMALQRVRDAQHFEMQLVASRSRSR